MKYCYSNFSATIQRVNRTYHVGFIGLGQMGYPMASNLALKMKPTSLKVMDTNISSADRLVKELGEKGVQAHVASDFIEFSKADVIITMLPAAAHVKQVVKSLIPHLKQGAYLIDSSTIDPDTCKWIKEFTSSKKVTVFDAPVSGGTPGAVAGTLTFMVGSPSKSDFEKVTLILHGMGKNIVYCGGNGMGQVAKICNNMMLGISMIAASETFALGASLGMDPKLLAS
jgi:3-hydroxyisobutyrate dehydrogenase